MDEPEVVQIGQRRRHRGDEAGHLLERDSRQPGERRCVGGSGDEYGPVGALLHCEELDHPWVANRPQDLALPAHECRVIPAIFWHIVILRVTP